jgi:hypothetical protein
MKILGCTLLSFPGRAAAWRCAASHAAAQTRDPGPPPIQAGPRVCDAPRRPRCCASRAARCVAPGERRRRRRRRSAQTRPGARCGTGGVLSHTSRHAHPRQDRIEHGIHLADLAAGDVQRVGRNSAAYCAANSEAASACRISCDVSRYADFAPHIFSTRRKYSGLAPSCCSLASSSNMHHCSTMRPAVILKIEIS